MIVLGRLGQKLGLLANRPLTSAAPRRGERLRRAFIITMPLRSVFCYSNDLLTVIATCFRHFCSAATWFVILLKLPFHHFLHRFSVGNYLFGFFTIRCVDLSQTLRIAFVEHLVHDIHVLNRLLEQ